MRIKDWLVTDSGECQARPSAREWDLIREHYYLHRFLTEIIDLLDSAPQESEEWDYLPQIRMRVRQLVMNSYWIQTQFQEISSITGVSILPLYDEIGYPLSIQNVTTAPAIASPIHNHGTWGVVALIKGREKHTFWRQREDLDCPGQIEFVGEKILNPGEIISFMPNAIHQVTAIGTEPVRTFHLYGDTQPKSRYRFEPLTNSIKRF